MTTEEKIEFNLDKFNPKKAELKSLADKYKDLKIVDFDDKEGFDKVHDARMDLRDQRIAIEKQGKKMREGANKFIKDVKVVENDLIGTIEPLEKDFKKQEDEYKAEKERIKKEKEEKKRLALQKRVDELAQYNYSHQDLFELSNMSEEDYNEMLAEKKTSFEEAEKIRKEKEEAERIEKVKNCLLIDIVHCKDLEQLDNTIKKIESEGFDQKEFEETIDYRKSVLTLEEEKKKMEAEKKKLQDEKDKIKKDELDKKRKEEEEKRIKEAEEKAKSEAIEEEKKRKEEEELKKKIKQKEEEEKLAKKKRYQNFLKKNEGKYDGFIDKDGERILYKVVDKFKFTV